MIHFVIYSSADSREIFFLCRSHFVVVVVFLIFTCPIAQLCLEKVRSAFKKHLSQKKKEILRPLRSLRTIVIQSFSSYFFH